MLTITMDYWKLGLIIVAVMMLGYLIIQAISWGIDVLLHRKKMIKIDEPPKQSKLIVDVPGPSDDIQAKNLKIWVADLDDTVQYLTSEFNDTKENFESFKQAVDDTISEQQEQIKKLEETTKDVINNTYQRVRIAELGIDKLEDRVNAIEEVEGRDKADSAVTNKDFFELMRHVSAAESDISKLEDRVNAIEHDIGDAFEEIHNNANEIDCVRREDKKKQPIFLEKDIVNGTPGVHCGPTTLQNAIDVLSNLRKEISNNGYVTMWYLDNLLDCPDKDDQTIDQFTKLIKYTRHGWFDLRRAYISLNPENKKYYINLPEEVKLYMEDYEVDWSIPVSDRFSICHEGFIYLKDAAKVLNRMRRYVEDYGFTTVRNFKRAMGDEDVKFTDKLYGWRDLSKAYIKRDKNLKFNIIMPKPILLYEDEGGD